MAVPLLSAYVWACQAGQKTTLSVDYGQSFPTACKDMKAWQAKGNSQLLLNPLPKPALMPIPASALDIAARLVRETSLTLWIR